MHAIEDLPTPPLHEATATICDTPDKFADGFPGIDPDFLAVNLTSTDSIQPNSLRSRSDSSTNMSLTGHAGVVSSSVKDTDEAS